MLIIFDLPSSTPLELSGILSRGPLTEYWIIYLSAGIGVPLTFLFQYTNFFWFFKMLGVDQFVCWFAPLLKKIVNWMCSQLALLTIGPRFSDSVRRRTVSFRCPFFLIIGTKKILPLTAGALEYIDTHLCGEIANCRDFLWRL